MKYIQLFLILAGLAAWASPLHAAEEVVAVSTAPAKPWSDKAETSYVSTNGNSKGTTTSVKNLFSYHWGVQSSLEVAAGGLGTTSGNQVTAENYNASEKFNWKLSGRNYVFERFGWDKDRFAGIRNRYDSSGGLGRLLLDFPADKLNGELGAGYVSEERTDAPRNDYPSGRAYTKYQHDFTKASNFSQDCEYIHNFNHGKDYRLNTETALTGAISTNLSLKASFVWKHNNEPPPGTVKDDTITSMALVINY